MFDLHIEFDYGANCTILISGNCAVSEKTKICFFYFLYTAASCTCATNIGFYKEFKDNLFKEIDQALSGSHIPEWVRDTALESIHIKLSQIVPEFYELSSEKKAEYKKTFDNCTYKFIKKQRL